MLVVLAELVVLLVALMAEVLDHHTTVAAVRPIFVLELIACMLELLSLAVEDLMVLHLKLVAMAVAKQAEHPLAAMVPAVAVVHKLPAELAVMEMAELLVKVAQV
nr:MAG TPA: hypothetical protein [Caudoviricetes sp.]